MMPYAGQMPQDEAAGLLAELVDEFHRRGRDQHVEALSVAIDAVTWFPLKYAPRDGTYVLLAVAPVAAFDAAGFIAVGRWVEPTDEELRRKEEMTLGKIKRQRIDEAGGWWSASKLRRPFNRPVLGWRPLPTFDFAAAGYGDDEPEIVGGEV